MPDGAIEAPFQKAVVNKWRNQTPSGKQQHTHWLDYYFDSHQCVFDPKCGHLRRKRKDPSACQKAMLEGGGGMNFDL